MGMFDSVLVNCFCGKTLEFQSKGGDCTLATYTLDNAPLDVLSDVNRHSPQRCSCGRIIQVDEERRRPVITGEPDSSGPLMISLEDGQVVDFWRMKDRGGSFQCYYGSRRCGEFDPEYLQGQPNVN